jgi:hypothetical protein
MSANGDGDIRFKEMIKARLLPHKDQIKRSARQITADNPLGSEPDLLE